MTDSNSEILERFHDSYVPDPNSGCWLWFAATTSAGYGQHRVAVRKREYAHRYSFETFVRPLNDKEHVLHKCDTPCCVNPDHLFAGSNQDNRSDMARKARGRGGSSLPFGVFPNHKRYSARISFCGTTRYLGTFDTVDEAATRRQSS